jgi:hypothetical protein
MLDSSVRTWALRVCRTCVSPRALLAVAVLVLAAQPSGVYARREVTFAYPYSRVWTAAVRLMRVDFECTITEKDKDDGYFLFEYPDHGKQYPGSVELVAIKDDAGESVRVVIQVPAMPSYVEGMMMERLGRKLEQEFGPAKEPKRPAVKEDPEHPGDGDKPKPEVPAKPRPGANDKP